MKIIRDGKGIVLTEQELCLAYEEYQRKMNIEIITSRLNGYLWEYELTSLRNNEEFLEAVAVDYQGFIDCGYEQDTAISDAINRNKDKYLNLRYEINVEVVN